MTEWKKFTGSDEQIEEMRKSGANGFLLRSSDKLHEGWIFNDNDDFSGIDAFNVTHYLICNPHPLADMICQQARTGQPVWIKEHHTNYYDGIIESSEELSYKTDTPNWYIPGASYSFTPFEE